MPHQNNIYKLISTYNARFPLAPCLQRPLMIKEVKVDSTNTYGTTPTYGGSNTMSTKPTATEGDITKKIENVTAKIPSIGYLSLALGSMALSASIAAFTERKALANFVGLWVPSFMLIGIYNKLVKLEGNDHLSKPASEFH